MRRYTTLFLLFCFPLLLVAGNIKLMTYNIETDKGFNFQSFRISKHAQVIASCGADIVAVQEVKGNSNFNNLKSKSGLSGHWYDIAGDGYGIGVLWNASLGTPTITNVKIDPAPGSSDTESRAYIIAEFEDFYFLSTHFSLDANDRDTMTASIINFADTAGKTVFVGGDFNAQPTYTAMQTFQSNGFNILNDLNHKTYTSSNPESLIDMILGFRKTASDKQYTMVDRGVPTPPSGVVLKDISDHLPYCVTVDIADVNTNEGLTVTNTNASGEGSFAQAFANAVAGDVINFNLDSTEITLPNAMAMKNITINGFNAFNGERVIFKPAGADKSFFTLSSGITGTFQNIVFDGTGILGNSAIDAANGSTLNIDNCVFKNINSQNNNGGAMRVQGVANISNSLFEGNYSNGSYGGGAICIYNAADVKIENSSFVGNQGQRGGAVMVNSTVGSPLNLEVYNSTFANNSVEGASNARGGAVYLQASFSAATLINSTFINCTFTGNYAINNGGGLCASAYSGKRINIDLINCIIAYNKTGSNSDIDVWNLNERVYFNTANNCIYGTAAGGAAGIVWTNSIQPADINLADIFEEIENWTGSFKRPVIANIQGLEVAKLSEYSIASGAGVATLSGFSIPTTDQIGNDRPSTPAIGALEVIADFSTRDIQYSGDENSTRIFVKNKTISFQGLSGAQMLSVYSMTGSLLHQSPVNNHEYLSLNHLSDNLVIVCVQGERFKIFLK
ncbi:MAG: Endonuclease/Exonuclease/phosphatase family protein [Bacteroidetes bacterium ADurb.Bin174]|nr:MAG: Endonuclease/Exonuclease/phosphatase family protein [Bacteroidetes bacterium ADurb.Bin174]